MEVAQKLFKVGNEEVRNILCDVLYQGHTISLKEAQRIFDEGNAEVQDALSEVFSFLLLVGDVENLGPLYGEHPDDFDGYKIEMAYFYSHFLKSCVDATPTRYKISEELRKDLEAYPDGQMIIIIYYYNDENEIIVTGFYKLNWREATWKHEWKNEQ